MLSFSPVLQIGEPHQWNIGTQTQNLKCRTPPPDPIGGKSTLLDASLNIIFYPFLYNETFFINITGGANINWHLNMIPDTYGVHRCVVKGKLLLLFPCNVTMCLFV